MQLSSILPWCWNFRVVPYQYNRFKYYATVVHTLPGASWYFRVTPYAMTAGSDDSDQTDRVYSIDATDAYCHEYYNPRNGY